MFKILNLYLYINLFVCVNFSFFLFLFFSVGRGESTRPVNKRATALILMGNVGTAGAVSPESQLFPMQSVSWSIFSVCPCPTLPSFLRYQYTEKKKQKRARSPPFHFILSFGSRYSVVKFISPPRMISHSTTILKLLLLFGKVRGALDPTHS